MEHSVGSFSMMQPQDFQLQGSEAEQETIARSIEPCASAATEHEQDTSAHDGSLEGYDPYSFSKEMEKLEEMSKTLETVKQKFNECSMRSLVLNADVVTLFDPVSSEELKSVVMNCGQCADRIAKMQAGTIEREISHDDQTMEIDNATNNTQEQSLVTTVTEEEPESELEPMESSRACLLDPPANED